MTRSPNQKRIEAALEHGDPDELRWAAYECRLRLRLVSQKRGGARWRSLLDRIEAALTEAGIDFSDTPVPMPSAMSARIRAERQQPGNATGVLLCVLNLPTLDVKQEARFAGSRQMSRLRRFLQEWLPETEAAREGASFTISAVVRHRSNQGVRRVILCRWRAGQSLSAALERTAEQWNVIQR